MTDAARPVAIETLLTHRAWVRSLAWSLVRDTHVVDEVEQETWLRALRSPPREEAAARGWLATVVRNVVRNRFRSESRREHHEGAAVPKTAAPGTGDVVARADVQQQLVRIVMGLDEPARSTLLLRFFDGLPPREVAARMGVPVETVRTRTRRALQRVRTQLEEERGGRRAAFAFLAPLLVEGPPLTGSESGEPSGTAADGAAAAASASVAATTTGALIMATATKKTALLAATVLLLLGGAGALVALSPGEGADAPDSTGAGAATAETGAGTRDRQRVAAGGVRDARKENGREAREEVSNAPPVSITVRRHDGTPAVDAAVVVDSGGAEPFVVRTGAAGSVEVERSDAIRWVVAAARGSVPGVGAVHPGQDAVAIELHEGVGLAGVVRVDGGAPGAPLRLRVQRDDATIQGAGAHPRMWRVLADDGFSKHASPVACDAAGRFRFQGLYPGETIWLVAPEGYRIGADWARGMHVLAPDTTLVVDLISLPRVTGRVVAASGAPVPNARVQLAWSEGVGSGSLGGTADADGAFALYLPSRELQQVTLTGYDPASGASVTSAVSAAGGDLGEVALPGSRRIRLLVRDPAGQPLPDAHVRTDVAQVRTAAAGTCSVVLPEGATDVTVAAAAFQPLIHSVPAGAAEPHAITLEPATRLTLLVGAGEAGEGRSVFVRVAADGDRLFELGPGGPEGMVDGVSEPDTSTESDFGDGRVETVVRYETHPGTPIVIDAIRPNVPFTVTLIDAMGHAHVSGELRLDAAERRTVGLTFDGPPRIFEGRVVDRDGKPVPRAFVHYEAARAATRFLQPPRVRTDEHGVFRIDGVRAPSLKLLVMDGASVPWSTEGAESGVEIRLEAARSTALTIVDAEGEIVTPEFVVADLETAWDANMTLWAADAEAHGVHRLEGLPDRPRIEAVVTIVTPTGERDVRISLDPRLAEQEVTLAGPDAMSEEAADGD